MEFWSRTLYQKREDIALFIANSHKIKVYNNKTGVDAICIVQVDPESIEPVLKQARDAGIVVVAHEGANLENVDYDIEAFSNAGYGEFIMDNLAEAMGEERCILPWWQVLQMHHIMNGQMQRLRIRRRSIQT